jgi:ubiquinone biosynthesis protein COQ4
MPALSVLGASWRLKPEEQSLLIGTYIPWALHAGSRSADLMCLYYERHFEVRHSFLCSGFCKCHQLGHAVF